MITRKLAKPNVNHPFLVAFGGKERAGKTTSADYIVEKHEGVKLSFADSLKAEVYDLNAIRGSDLDAFLTYANGRQFDFDFHGFPRANLNNPRRADKVSWINRDKATWRPVLQIYGDWKRSTDPDYFLNRTLQAIEAAVTDGTFVIAIDDLRYRNEMAALENIGFNTIRVNTGDEFRKQRGATGHGDHPSETDLDAVMHDFVVHNNMEPHDLHRQLDKVVIEAINRE